MASSAPSAPAATAPGGAPPDPASWARAPHATPGQPVRAPWPAHERKACVEPTDSGERLEVLGHLQTLRRCLASSQGRGAAGWQRAIRVEVARLQGAGAAPLHGLLGKAAPAPRRPSAARAAQTPRRSGRLASPGAGSRAASPRPEDVPVHREHPHAGSAPRLPTPRGRAPLAAAQQKHAASVHASSSGPPPGSAERAHRVTANSTLSHWDTSAISTEHPPSPSLAPMRRMSRSPAIPRLGLGLKRECLPGT